MIDWIKRMLLRYRRILTFGVCGALNTAVHWGVFTLFYALLHVDSGLSHGIGYAAGSVCGYLLNSSFTFREGKGRTRAQFVQYVGVDAVLIFVSSLLMELLERAGCNVWLVEIGLTAVFALVHYFIFKYLVFRIKKEDDR